MSILSLQVVRRFLFKTTETMSKILCLKQPKIENFEQKCLKGDVKVVVFDLETNGIPPNWAWNVRKASSTVWPHIVQIAWQIFTPQHLQVDETQSQVISKSMIIQPDGWVITKENQDKHGISQEKAESEGLPIEYVLNVFYKAIKELKNQGNEIVVICHNLDFDWRVIEAEQERLLIQNINLNFDQLVDGRWCSMKGLIDLCQLNWNEKYQSYKWPSLEELHEFCFLMSFKNQHNAGADVAATVKSFECILSNFAYANHLPEWLRPLGLEWTDENQPITYKVDYERYDFQIEENKDIQEIF